jgi:hypothetical protein
LPLYRTKREIIQVYGLTKQVQNLVNRNFRNSIYDPTIWKSIHDIHPSIVQSNECLRPLRNSLHASQRDTDGVKLPSFGNSDTN